MIIELTFDEDELNYVWYIENDNEYPDEDYNIDYNIELNLSEDDDFGEGEFELFVFDDSNEL